MRILPCATCKDGHAKVGQQIPYYAARWLGSARVAFAYQCGECGTRATITAPQFNSLPDLPEGEWPKALQDHLRSENA